MSPDNGPGHHIPRAPKEGEVRELFEKFENDPDEHIVTARTKLFNSPRNRNLSPGDMSYLRAFTAVAYHFHSTQNRFTGEPYVTHSMAVATMIAEDPHIPDEQLVDHEVAALGHDLRELGVERRFLKRFADSELVKGIESLSKIASFKFGGKKPETSVYFKRILRGNIRERRIKIADWIHNLQTTPRSKEDFLPETWDKIDRFQTKFPLTEKYILPLIRSLPIEAEREYWYGLLNQTFIENKPVGMEDLELGAL